MKQLLKYIPTAIVALSLVASPVFANRGHFGGGYHGGYHNHFGGLGAGLIIGGGLGILGAEAYSHDWHNYQPYYNAPYYSYRPVCPYGAYPVESPYRPGTFFCDYD